MRAIVNANVVLPDRVLENGQILMENGRILAIGQELPLLVQCECFDAQGLLAGPGFVDEHCHAGGDCWAYEDPVGMAKHHLLGGTTTLLCTIYHDIGVQGALDAMEKVRLQTDDILYMEIEDYFAFEYLSPHLDGLDISLNELNDLAAQLAALDEVQGIAFEGMFSIEVQRKVNANGGVITLQDLRDLAVSARTDCYHVVDAADDAALGRFYAENDFIPELDGISDEVFEMLDFAGIGRMMRCSENGVFVGSLYVLRDGELTTAPPCAKDLPEKPGYLFRLTLGLHPDIGDARTVTLDLPAAEAELLDAQEQLGVEGWEGVTVIDYDGIIPYAAEFTDLPMELEEFNAFTKAARDIPRSEVPKLKALLEQFEVQDIETAMLLTEHLADYILTPNLSSPQEAALDQLCFIMDREEAVRLISYVNLFNYGETVIHADNAALTSYGLLHRADYEPMLSPMQQKQEKEMTMQ